MNTIVDIQKATNSELLSRFEEGRDQAAFAEIVRRHGSMVRQTAWRVTGSIEDSEDAFQAAFLALSKSVHRIRDKAALAGWLHRAALLSALQVQRANVNWERRGEEMRQRDVAEECSPSTEVTAEEMRQIMEKEIAALPRKLQRAIVLCDVEGLSRAEAARDLGVPRSTVDSQVTKGRQILRSRMTRLGVSIPAAGFAAFIADSSGSSLAMSAELIKQTTTNAVLFSAGKDASELGLSPRIIEAANEVVAKMRTAFLLPIACSVVLLSVAVAYSAFVYGAPATVSEGMIVADSFDEGSTYNESRLGRWTPAPFLSGSFDTSSGNMVLSPTEDTDPRFGFGIGLLNVVSGDSSIRTEAKVTASGGAAFVEVRVSSDVKPTGYFAAVGFAKEWGGSVFIVGRSDGLGQQHLFESLNGSKFVLLPHDVRKSFTVIQLDVIGDRICGWAWRTGNAQPKKPLFDIVDNTFESGFPSLAVGTNLTTEAKESNKAIFKFVQFANRPIHEVTEVNDLLGHETSPRK